MNYKEKMSKMSYEDIMEQIKFGEYLKSNLDSNLVVNDMFKDNSINAVVFKIYTGGSTEDGYASEPSFADYYVIRDKMVCNFDGEFVDFDLNLLIESIIENKDEIIEDYFREHDWDIGTKYFNNCCEPVYNDYSGSYVDIYARNKNGLLEFVRSIDFGAWND